MNRLASAPLPGRSIYAAHWTRLAKRWRVRCFPSRKIFSEPDAVLAARLFNRTGRRSRSLADCMIAAVAIRCGAKLATINAADFQPFTAHGLLLA